MQTLPGLLMVYFLPIQLVVGLVGNTLNLIVLLNRRMRSRTNVFLAAVAFADIFFLLLMLPMTIKYNAFLRQFKVLNLFMQYSNHHFIGFINMCAFASTWFLVTVCFERLLAVRWPLKARIFWSNRARPSRMICLVWALAFLVTVHSHVTHTIIEVPVGRNRNASNLYSSNAATRRSLEFVPTEEPVRYVLRPHLRPNMFHYWRIATILHTVLQVFVPVVLVLLTSFLTADALFSVCRSPNLLKPLQLCLPWIFYGYKQDVLDIHQQHGSVKTSVDLDRNMQRLLSSASSPPAFPHQFLCNGSASSNSYNTSSSPSNQKRATVVVLVIACTFALFQLPSAVIYIWELMQPDAPLNQVFISVATIANSLVVTGKMANFFLLCMSSRNFRRNLKRIVWERNKSAKSSLSGAAIGANTTNALLHHHHHQQYHFPLLRQRPESTPNRNVSKDNGNKMEKDDRDQRERRMRGRHSDFNTPKNCGAEVERLLDEQEQQCDQKVVGVKDEDSPNENSQLGISILPRQGRWRLRLNSGESTRTTPKLSRIKFSSLDAKFGPPTQL